MSTFISHSLQDVAAYSSLRLALEGKGIRCWDPRSLTPGSSLRNQLRDAIESCDVCVFVATRNSLASQWCGAELGAFWGASKRVVVFLAESQLSESEIPPQFKGDLWTRDVVEVVQAVKAEIAAAAERRRAASLLRRTPVSELTIVGLHKMLAWMRGQRGEGISAPELLTKLRDATKVKIFPADASTYADMEAEILPLAIEVSTIPATLLLGAAKEVWEYSFRITTSTGAWFGFAAEAIRATAVDDYERCLLVRAEDETLEGLAVVQSVWERGDEIKFGRLYAVVGKKALGDPLGVQW